MKHTTLVLASIAVLSASAAQAQYRSGSNGYQVARVVSAKPIYETVQVDQGREVCRNEVVRIPSYQPRRRSESGEVLGAIIGGVIGNQFGSGRGRAAATVAGVALGSAVARDSQRYDNGRYSERTERVCSYEPSYRTQRELVGYDVTYDYNGQVGYTTTRSRPGNTIRVQVSVTALED